MTTKQCITYRTQSIFDCVPILIFLALLVFPCPSFASPKPFWWSVAEKASHDAWLRSLDCRCEKAFAIDLKGEQIIVRWFEFGHPQEYSSQGRIIPETAAMFHTHLYDSIPSSQDRELQKKSGIPIYVIHENSIVESK
jgi:hypothetical protein